MVSISTIGEIISICVMIFKELREMNKKEDYLFNEESNSLRNNNNIGFNNGAGKYAIY